MMLNNEHNQKDIDFNQWVKGDSLEFLQEQFQCPPFVKGNKLNQAALTQLLTFLNAHPEIIYLNISSCLKGDVLAQALAENRTLKKLRLHNCNIEDLGAIKLAENITLEHLDLSYNHIKENGVVALAKNQTLKHLNLERNYARVQGATALGHNTTLVSLNIKDNMINFPEGRNGTTSNAGAISLAGNKNLKFLDISSNDLNETEIRALAENSTLRTLIIQHNKNVNNTIGPQEAMRLAKNTTLKSLNLYGNDIGDEGAVFFLENATLTSLNLGKNALTHESVHKLLGNKHLRTLKLDNNYLDCRPEDLEMGIRTIESGKRHFEDFLNLWKELFKFMTINEHYLKHSLQTLSNNTTLINLSLGSRLSTENQQLIDAILTTNLESLLATKYSSELIPEIINKSSEELESTSLNDVNHMMNDIQAPIARIQHIKNTLCTALKNEMNSFLKQKNVNKPDELTSTEQARYRIIENLHNEIIKITINTIRTLGMDTSWEQSYQKQISTAIKHRLSNDSTRVKTPRGDTSWEQSCQEQISAIIQTNLSDNRLGKKDENIDIMLFKLLNLLTSLFSSVKQTVTGLGFFSPEEKQKEGAIQQNDEYLCSSYL